LSFLREGYLESLVEAWEYIVKMRAFFPSLCAFCLAAL